MTGAAIARAGLGMILMSGVMAVAGPASAQELPPGRAA